MTLADAIHCAKQQLSSSSATPRLDAELLVALSCQKSRAYIYCWPQQPLTITEQQQLEDLVTRRRNGEPMAYILGQQEFWSLTFSVTPATLIPRPETEHLIEWVLAHYGAHENIRVADLGTGCGAIAIAIASERALWQIDATDQSSAALTIAQQNATQLQQNVNFYCGHWCEALPRRDYHLIMSNPPYIAADDPHLTDLRYEPHSALVAGIQGLDAIQHIAQEAHHYLLPGGYLLLEHGCDQAAMVVSILQHAGFINIKCHTDLAGLSRFSVAQKSV